MQLRFTKGVGIALAIAASCAVLGFLMAPGWFVFAAFSAWWGFVLALGGKPDPTPDEVLARADYENRYFSGRSWHPTNVWNKSSS